ncbi:cyclic nucleotide-binding domain-containing protein [Acidiferrimicrobium sp. IK]|uniref:Crp/Fnr family transcriptional regulator n=1 Tax=Acidiferrimicrobium sp. IK TaxID=2871700 RepID=UPI0021CB8CA9|nr:cyclic nucleotide-binding domain-containing protein [Acidiferrimicrobium sp. IK]MCU4187498.1 cyclic nucleotide-binding domain-containing protein [Acidiferrimicrobium sp. IK]
MEHDDKVALVQSMPLFSGCSRKEAALVAALLVEEHLAAGQVLARQGQDAGTAYLIVDGTASVIRNGHQLATLGPQDIVGEMSLLDKRPRVATVTALTDMRVLALTHEDLDALLLKVPSLAYNLLSVLARRLGDLDRESA